MHISHAKLVEKDVYTTHYEKSTSLMDALICSVPYWIAKQSMKESNLKA